MGSEEDKNSFSYLLSEVGIYPRQWCFESVDSMWNRKWKVSFLLLSGSMQIWGNRDPRNCLIRYCKCNLTFLLLKRKWSEIRLCWLKPSFKLDIQILFNLNTHNYYIVFWHFTLIHWDLRCRYRTQNHIVWGIITPK